MSEIATKLCKGCLEIKPTDEFYKDIQRPDKLNRKCKTCVRLYLAAPHRVERQGELVASYKTLPNWKARRQEYQRQWREKKRNQRDAWKAEHERLKK